MVVGPRDRQIRQRRGGRLERLDGSWIERERMCMGNGQMELKTDSSKHSV